MAVFFVRCCACLVFCSVCLFVCLAPPWLEAVVCSLVVCSPRRYVSDVQLPFMQMQPQCCVLINQTVARRVDVMCNLSPFIILLMLLISTSRLVQVDF